MVNDDALTMDEPEPDAKDSSPPRHLPALTHEGTFTGGSVRYQSHHANMQFMRILARLTALVLALLLLTQAGWAELRCEAGAEGPAESTHHQGLPAGHHQPMPAPADHHGACQVALCVTMSGCAPAALHTAAPNTGAYSDSPQRIAAFRATSSPFRPAEPEPPPPRA